MNKKFKYYAVFWLVLVAVFNVIVFVSPAEAAGMNKFGGAFWSGYIFIMAAFVGQLVCAFFALKEDNARKIFYKLPLITISYSGLIVMIVFGTLAMAIPNLPNWVGIIVCALVLMFTVLSLTKASLAAELVEKVDEKVKTKTFFIKSLAIDAETLMNGAKYDDAKAACRKVFEAVRYSDPMSNDALAGVESQITLKFNEFSEAVKGEKENVSSLADEMVVLITDRNKKCRLLK